MKTSGKTLYIALAAALALSLAFTACSDGGGGGSGKKTVVNVSITPPDKTEYVLGEDSQLDLAGLTVTVTFSDGSSLTLHGEDLAVTGFDPGAEGEQTVTVSYDKNGIAFERTFTVRVTSGESAPTYSVSASPLASFGALQTPYEPPAAQTVTVTNTGDQPVTLDQPSAENYEIGALSTAALAANGDTATFTVRPKAGLPVGNYDETINISGTGDASAAVNAEFAVSATPTYSISASAIPSFGPLPAGYAQPAAQTVTVTNTGDQPVTLDQPSAENYEIGTLSTAALAANGDTATFTVRPKAGLAAGNYNETINISGTGGASAAVEAEFTVTVAPPKSVTVAAQSGTMIAGTASQSVTFAVTTENIPGGFSATTTWYTSADGMTATTAPAGVTVSSTPLSPSGTATVTMTGSASTAAGIYYFKISYDDASSDVKTLTISARTVGVGAQIGTLNASATGQTVTFSVTAANIANGSYTATVANLPAGVTVQGNVTISSGGSGTLTLAGSASTVQGVYSDLTLTIGGVTSEAFTLTVASALAKNVTVGSQSAPLTAGAAGSATFPVTASNIANGQAGAVLWFYDSDGTTAAGAPAGISASVSNTVSGAATVTVNATAAAAGGEYYFKVTIDSTTSTTVTLTVNIFAGAGTALSPYEIGTAAQLAKLAELVEADNQQYNPNAGGVYYKLTSDDINLNVAPYNSGTGWMPIGGGDGASFTGVFDGDGKTISGLYINDSGRDYAGLFGHNSDTAVVKNLNLTGVNITANNYAGGVVGQAWLGGSISNCSVSGSVSGNGAVGGVAGNSYNGNISNCSVSGTVSGSSQVGGVAGNIGGNNVCGIINCYSSATVSGSTQVGGIVGIVEDNSSSIANCYASGTVTSTGNIVGGVAGHVSGGASLINCYATGAVNGGTYPNIGGVAGWLDGTASKIENCAALNPSVKGGSNVGRVVGYFSGGNMIGNLALESMGTDGGTAFPAGAGLTHLNGYGIDAPTATTQVTYSGTGANQLGWSFGTSDASPWQWAGGDYPLPVLYWQTTAPTLPGHLE